MLFPIQAAAPLPSGSTTLHLGFLVLAPLMAGLFIVGVRWSGLSCGC